MTSNDNKKVFCCLSSGCCFSEAHSVCNALGHHRCRSGLRNRNVANSKQLRERFEGAQKTEAIDQLAREFLQAVEAGT